jgi:phage tail sheath protein FI
VPEYLTPGVYFELQDAAPPVVRRLRMDITGFVGLTERGPLNVPVRIDSWRQFQAIFGNFVPYGFLAYAVKGFFENGGRTCFIVRIAGTEANKATLTFKTATGNDVLKLFAINEGQWGNKIAATLTDLSRKPGRFEEETFSLLITHNLNDQESFRSLSIDPSSPRYFLRILNQGDERTAPSRWIRVEDRMPTGVSFSESWLPDPHRSDLRNRTGILSGGQDGVASLTKDDFLGSADLLTPDQRGLSVLDKVDAVGIVCIPDIHIQPIRPVPPPPPPPESPTDPCLPACAVLPTVSPSPLSEPELPPTFSEDDVLDIQRALIEHCEYHRDRVAILDSLRKPGGNRPLTLEEIQAQRREFASDRGFAALYYPWIKVVDPLRLDGRPVREIPPCGHIAGIYARSDASVGVHKAPANAEILWAEDVTVEINDDEQAILNPEGINCLRAFPGRGIRVYGARTISKDSDWRYVNVRRLLLMIEEAVDESTQWSVFEPNSFNLRQLIRVSISGFLESLWRQGALVGASQEDAFYVRCDETNNPPSVIDQGRLIADIGVRPADPAEFIIFRIGRTAEELEVVER